MIAIDTNILARSILNDDEIQSEIARNKIKTFLKADGVFISSYSVLELVWIMTVKKKTKFEIVKTIETLLQTNGIYIGNDDCIRKAIGFYKKGKADFCDYLIYFESIDSKSEELMTFDKKFAKDFNGKFVKQL